jgi:DNA-directed RNA polymerase I, II, and III subunit RPABC3
MKLTRKGKSLIEVRVCSLNQSGFPIYQILVSRLVAVSQNDEINLTLDYNIELFSLQIGDNFSLALATSLSRTGPTAGEEGAEAEKNDWRPDRKGKTGSLDDDYDYVMYGKVCLALHF